MREKYDIVMIGHVSKDIMIYEGEEERLLGGAVVYSSAAAARSGASVLVVTKAAGPDRHELTVMEESGADVLVQETPKTTSIRNEYHTPDREKRTVTLLARADSFTLDDIPDVQATIFDLAGLFAGELPVSLIEPLSHRGAVAIDAQGVLRTAVGERLEFRRWEEKEAYLPHVTYLKTDAAEAEILTGESDRERACRLLLDAGASEVMVTHNSEVIVGSAGKIYRAPLTPRNLSGRTGRGDTCFAAYLTHRMKHGIQESVEYAAALVSMKMESPGVFRGTPEQVMKRIRGEV